MPPPKPEKALVIRYDYLWRDQKEQGRDEPAKDRPCVIIGVVDDPSRETRRVFIAPITTTTPTDRKSSLEIPVPICRRLGLDEMRSWVKTNEVNIEESWPQSVLRIPRGSERGKFFYGHMPEGFFRAVLAQMHLNRQRQQLRAVQREKAGLENPEYRRGRGENVKGAAKHEVRGDHPRSLPKRQERTPAQGTERQGGTNKNGKKQS